MIPIPQNLLQGVIYPLLILILVIALAVVIAELKKSLEEKKIKQAELERKRAFREKMEALKKRKEELEKLETLEREVVTEKLAKERAGVAVEMERERREWELTKIYSELLSKSYFELLEVLPRGALEKVTKNRLTSSRIPLRVSDRGFTTEGFVSEQSLHNFVLSLLKEYDDKFGSPISNLVLGAIKEELKERELENFSEGLKTLSLLDLGLKSVSYLVEEPEPLQSYQLFSKLLRICPGLCVTRQSIEKIKEKYGTKFELYWLTKIKAERTIDPTDLEKLMQLLEKFIEPGKKVILLDGLEYLIVQNSYKTILKFIQSLTSIIVLRNSILIVPVNPSALEPRELALLEREMKVIK